MAKIEFSKEKFLEGKNLDQTLLEAALDNGIPHEHACGGNGLCSTCRVLIFDGLHNVRPRNEIEQKLALAKGFENRVRLACQTKINRP